MSHSIQDQVQTFAGKQKHKFSISDVATIYI